jgi:choline dehydrogenase-like flavoprotein
MSTNTYDAIVIGSGISGGWAAKELTEKGLKTIMLERGKNIEHIKDYVNANKGPWEFPNTGRPNAKNDRGLSRFKTRLSVKRN